MVIGRLIRNNIVKQINSQCSESGSWGSIMTPKRLNHIGKGEEVPWLSGIAWRHFAFVRHDASGEIGGITLGLNAPWKKSRQYFVHCRSVVDTVVVGTCSLGVDSTMNCLSSCPSGHKEVNYAFFLSDCAFGTGKGSPSLLSCSNIHALLEKVQFCAWKVHICVSCFSRMLDLTKNYFYHRLIWFKKKKLPNQGVILLCKSYIWSLSCTSPCFYLLELSGFLIY